MISGFDNHTAADRDLSRMSMSEHLSRAREKWEESEKRKRGKGGSDDTGMKRKRSGYAGPKDMGSSITTGLASSLMDSS